MDNKIITDAGKKELLRLGFVREEAGGAFQYLALGGENSNASQGGQWSEIGINDSNYSRVKTHTELTDKTISITGIFEEENYAPPSGGKITEIALCNSDGNEGGLVYFLYSKVPEIMKTGDISLEYTIILSID